MSNNSQASKYMEFNSLTLTVLKALHPLQIYSSGALSSLNQGKGNDYEMIFGGFMEGGTAVE